MAALPPNRLEHLREAQDLTRRELARRLGVDEDVIGGWESRKTSIPGPRQRQLAYLFGCRVGHLMCHDEDGDGGPGGGLRLVA